MTSYEFWSLVLKLVFALVIIIMFRPEVRDLLRRVREGGGIKFDGDSPAVTQPREDGETAPDMTPAEGRLDRRVDRTVKADWSNCADIFWLGYNLVAAGLTVGYGGPHERASRLLRDAQHHLDLLHFSEPKYAERLFALSTEIMLEPETKLSVSARRFYWKQVQRLRDELSAHFEVQQRRLAG